MTDTLDTTAKKVLNDGDPNRIGDAMRLVALGDLLSNLATRKTETKAVNATFQCTLTSLPLQGSIRAARKTGGYLAQTEVVQGVTLAASQFKVNYATGQVTFETTDFNDTDEADFEYLAVGTLAVDLAKKLNFFGS